MPKKMHAMEENKNTIAHNAIVFRDMYLQCPARNNNCID